MSFSASRAPKAVHPGRILVDYIADSELSQSAVARRLRVPIGNINEICRGKRGISPEMAVKLGKFFGTSAELWLNLQKSWELSRVNPIIANDIKPLKRAA